jgi:hypothetical protein
VVQVALLLLLLLLLPLWLLRALGPVPLSCVAFQGGLALRPRFPRPSFLPGVLPEVLQEAVLPEVPAWVTSSCGHRWNRRHPSLVAMDKCALSWQMTMLSMCS